MSSPRLLVSARTQQVCLGGVVHSRLVFLGGGRGSGGETVGLVSPPLGGYWLCAVCVVDETFKRAEGGFCVFGHFLLCSFQVDDESVDVQ